MTSPLVGVWELVSDTHQGLLINAGTHQIHLVTAKDRELFSNMNGPTETEELAAFRTMNSSAGSCSVSGSATTCVATYNVELSKNPNFVGATPSIEFTFEGDKMIEKMPSGETQVWRKIG